MPYKAKHPCNYSGCNELTTERYCENHKSEQAKVYNKLQRNQERQRFYDSPAWRKLRKIKLHTEPFCEMCKCNGVLTKATCVDHKIEIDDGGAALDITNLQALCWSCHSRKTLIERGKRFASKGKTR
jgi:5-methylcytosine-specific restriction protein A